MSHVAHRHWHGPRPVTRSADGGSMKVSSHRSGVLSAALLAVAGCTGAIGDAPTGAGGAASAGTGGSGAVTGTGGAGSSGTGGSVRAGTAGSIASGGGGGGQVTGAGEAALPCRPLQPLPRRLWRLSVEQWGAAVKELL